MARPDETPRTLFLSRLSRNAATSGESRSAAPAQTRTFDNKALAEKWARGLETEIDNGVLVDRRAAERTTLAEILKRYRRDVTPTKRGARDENLRLKAMALRPFAGIRMAAWTSSYLAAYRDDRLKVVFGAAINRGALCRASLHSSLGL